MADGSGSSKQYRHTYERFLKVVPSRNILVVTLASFAAAARRELPELSAGAVSAAWCNGGGTGNRSFNVLRVPETLF